MERNWPWVSEVLCTKLRSWEKQTLHALIGTSLHCIAERGCGRARGGQTEIGMILLKNVPVPYLGLWHSSDPLLGTAMAQQISSHWAHSTIQPGAHCRAMPKEEKEEGENRANQAMGQRYTTDSWGYIILLCQPCTSEQRPCQTRKSFPHPTSTSVLRLSIIKKRIWIVKPFKSMPTAGANKNKSESWAMLITVASFHRTHFLLGLFSSPSLGKVGSTYQGIKYVYFERETMTLKRPF